MLPVYPDRVMLPVEELIQIGLLPPEVVPPTDSGSTTTWYTEEYCWLHDPLLTSALNSHVPAVGGV